LSGILVTVLPHRDNKYHTYFICLKCQVSGGYFLASLYSCAVRKLPKRCVTNKRIVNVCSCEKPTIWGRGKLQLISSTKIYKFVVGVISCERYLKTLS